MSPDEIITAATRLGATVVRGPGADIIIMTRAEPAEEDLIPLPECAQIAKTSVRVVKESIRAGDLAAFGKQRDRCVRRADLSAWIKSRRVKPVLGPDDAEVERWMRQKERAVTRPIAPTEPKPGTLRAAGAQKKPGFRRGQLAADARPEGRFR